MGTPVDTPDGLELRPRDFPTEKYGAVPDLPPGHPDRMIAAQVVLYVGLGIVIAIVLYRRLVPGER